MLEAYQFSTCMDMEMLGVGSGYGIDDSVFNNVGGGSSGSGGDGNSEEKSDNGLWWFLGIWVVSSSSNLLNQSFWNAFIGGL